MARRENQGLQIALILLVLFSALMSVLTYVFWSRGEKLSQQLEQTQTERSNAQTAMNRAIDENQRLKVMIGAGPETTFAEVEAQVAEQMAMFGSTVAEENRNLLYLPTFLVNATRERENSYQVALNNSNTLKQEKAEIDKTTKEKIATVEESQVNAVTDFQQEKAKFNEDRLKFQAETDRLKSEFDRDRAKLETQITGLEEEKTKAAKDIGRLELQVQQLVKQISEMKNETFEVPDGEITWVNQKSKYVYLNLGIDDGLQRLTEFKVYDGGENNLADAKPKGRIEVVRIIGPHRAEAMILEDENTNPLLRGDVVYTPLWKAGNPMRFALAGMMDIDGDGASDRQKIKDIITMNGGVIDAEIDDSGKRTGELTLNTTYLVLGKRPNERDADMVQEFTKIINEAKELGIKEITIDKLVTDLDYRGADRKRVEDTRTGVRRNVTGEQEGVESRFRRRPLQTRSSSSL